MSKIKFCKKGMGVILFIAIILINLPVSVNIRAESDNLFGGGTFESGLPPNTTGGSRVEWSHDYYQGTGCGSCKVIQTSTYGGVYFPTVLDNGKYYRFSLYTRFDPGSAGNKSINFAYRVNQNGALIRVVKGITISNTANWTLIEGEFLLQESDYSSLELLIYANDGPNTFYIDNLEIKNYPVLYENQFAGGNFNEASQGKFTTAAASFLYENAKELVYEGSSALRLTQTSVYGNISQRVCVLPGKKYFVSAYSRIRPEDIYSSTLAFDLILNGQDIIFAEGPKMTPDSGYVRTTGICTIPQMTVGDARISLFAYPYNSKPVSFMLDDVQFFEIEDFKISGSFPQAGGVCTPTKVIALKFNQSIDTIAAGTLTNFKLNGSSSNIQSVKVESDKDCTITLIEPLAADTGYTLSVSGLNDIYGQALSNPSFNFTTEANAPASGVFANDYKIYLNYGAASQEDITDSILSKGSVTGVIDYIYNTSGAKNIFACMALYNEGKLVNISQKQISISENNIMGELVTGPIDIPDTTSGSFTLKTFLWDSDSMFPLLNSHTLVDYKLHQITVKPDGTGNFTTPKLANDSISDSGPKNLYNIIIYPGIYTDVEWVVKPYTTLIGTDRDSCWLKGENPPGATNNEIDNRSTVWLVSTAGLENLKITSKNMRYPVHSEAEGYNKNAVHRIKNCYIENYGDLEAVQYRQNWIAQNPNVIPIPVDKDPAKVWGGISGEGSAAWGYGSGSGILETFENTTFVSKNQGWYVHNREDFEKPQINILNNSHISGGYTNGRIMQIESLGSGTEDQVIFNNCTFDGVYVVQDDYPWITQKSENQYADHSDYSLTFNNCDPIGYADAHRGLALAIYSNSIQSVSNVRVSGSAAPVIFGNITQKDGGGGLKGYSYGNWDISGISVGLGSNITVANTLGRRLGDCTSSPKTMDITFNSAGTRSVVFNADYTDMTNDEILAIINNAIAGEGTACSYNIPLNEYYPKMTDKEFYLKNTSLVGIPRFAAVCYDRDSSSIRLMNQNDTAEDFIGVALEQIVPGQSGRILTEGFLSNNQLYGFSGSIDSNSNITITIQGGFEPSGSGPAVMHYVFPNWVSFTGNKNYIN